MLKTTAMLRDEEEENAIKEILQEIVLCGLSRAGFFYEAKKDVLPFIKDPRSVNLWSKDFFCEITKGLSCIE